MNAPFGPNTGRVLEIITELPELSPEQMNLVTTAWKQASSRARAEAWAQLLRGTTRQERYRFLAAASLARHVAIGAARRLDRLTRPFAAVMPSLAQDLGQARQDTA